MVTLVINFGVSQGILVGVLAQYQDEIVIQTQNAVQGTPGAQPTVFLNSKVGAIRGPELHQFRFHCTWDDRVAILLRYHGEKHLHPGGGVWDPGPAEVIQGEGFSLMFGSLIPWSLVVVVQVIILLVVAVAIGFHWQGGLNSTLLAILVGVIGGIASIALGMIIAAFVTSVSQATNLKIAP